MRKITEDKTKPIDFSRKKNTRKQKNPFFNDRSLDSRNQNVSLPLILEKGRRRAFERMSARAWDEKRVLRFRGSNSSTSCEWNASPLLSCNFKDSSRRAYEENSWNFEGKTRATCIPTYTSTRTSSLCLCASPTNSGMFNDHANGLRLAWF